MKINITKYDLLLRFGAVLVSLLAPFIMILCVGERPSISSYWETSMQPLFIFVNAATSYYFITLRRWIYSGVLLLLLTAFSVSMFPVVHNVMAIAFFLVNLYPIIELKRHPAYLIWYMSSFFVFPFSLLWAEIIAVMALCAIHIHGLWDLYQARKIRKQVEAQRKSE